MALRAFFDGLRPMQNAKNKDLTPMTNYLEDS